MNFYDNEPVVLVKSETSPFRHFEQIKKVYKSLYQPLFTDHFSLFTIF